MHFTDSLRDKEWGPDLAERFTPNTQRRRHSLIIINIATAVCIAFLVVTRPLPKSFVSITLFRVPLIDPFDSASEAEIEIVGVRYVKLNSPRG